MTPRPPILCAIALSLACTINAQPPPPTGLPPEPVRWEAQTWQIADRPAFRVSFENFLDASDSEIAARGSYDLALDRIAGLLPPGKIAAKNLDEAFALLPGAASSPEDSQLCNAIALQILRAWQAQHQTARLEAAEPSLSETRDAPGTRMLEAARSTADLSPAQARKDFQNLIVRLFLQRRFRHVAIASAFYRNIFDDAGSRLRPGADTRALFVRSSDIPPTIASLDGLAKAATHATRENIATAAQLLAAGRLHGASLRLAEAFAAGEHLPDATRFPRTDRQRLLPATKARHRLEAALEAKDFGQVEQLAAAVRQAAPDFDPADSIAQTDAARARARQHLERARRAAEQADAGTVVREVRAASEIWPSNPELAEFSEESFDAGSINRRATDEFDRLMARGDHAEILRQKTKFLAATSSDAERSAKLAAILEERAGIDDALRRARAIQSGGDAAGAWESLQPAAARHPDDAGIKRMSAELAGGGAAPLIRALDNASELESGGNLEKARDIYRDLVRQYPRSRLAKDRLEALQKRIPPADAPEPAP